MIAILAAMDEELAPILKLLPNAKLCKTDGLNYYEQELNQSLIIVAKTGVGKVNAAMVTTQIINKFSPQLIINAGSAGGLHSPDCKIAIGDIVIANQVASHDIDLTAIGYEIGRMPAMPLFYEPNASILKLACECTKLFYADKFKVGLILSGDKFVGDDTTTAKLNLHFPNAVALEMEAAAVAQVCFKLKTNWLIVRSISDIAGKESAKNFEKSLQLAASNSAKMILQLLKSPELA